MSSAAAAFTTIRIKDRSGRGLAAGEELDLISVIFGRIARWLARTGAEAATVTAAHDEITLLAPGLLGRPAEITKHRVSDLAYAWRSAFENGVQARGAVNSGEPRYRVTFFVTNANAQLRFWFSVDEEVSPSVFVSRLPKPAVDRLVSLTDVVENAVSEPDYEYLVRVLGDGVQRGHPAAVAAWRQLRGALAASLIVLLIGVVTFRLLPDKPRRALEHAIGRCVPFLERAHPPSSERAAPLIAANPEHRTRPRVESFRPIPRLPETGQVHVPGIRLRVPHFSGSQAVVPGDLPSVGKPADRPAIDAYVPSISDPGLVIFDVWPSPRAREVAISYDDGTPGSTAAVGPDGFCRFGHRFRVWAHTRTTFTIHAHVSDGFWPVEVLTYSVRIQLPATHP